jgi:hypothetical protein
VLREAAEIEGDHLETGPGNAGGDCQSVDRRAASYACFYQRQQLLVRVITGLAGRLAKCLGQEWGAE